MMRDEYFLDKMELRKSVTKWKVTLPNILIVQTWSTSIVERFLDYVEGCLNIWLIKQITRDEPWWINWKIELLLDLDWFSVTPLSWVGIGLLNGCANILQRNNESTWEPKLDIISSRAGCNITSDAAMKKEFRGTTEIKTVTVEVELRAIKLFDNRGAALLNLFATL